MDPSARTLSGETPPQYPRQDSNLRHRLRRPVLYPLSYGGLHATNDAVGFILPILSSPSSVSSRPSLRRAAADLAVAAGRLSADATAATGPNRPGCPGLSGPPALLPWSPHLRAAVAGRHPRLSGELSPLPPTGDKPLADDRSALCCGCCHRALRTDAPACCFAGPTCIWQSGSSSEAAPTEVSPPQRRIHPLRRW